REGQAVDQVERVHGHLALVLAVEVHPEGAPRAVHTGAELELRRVAGPVPWASVGGTDPLDASHVRRLAGRQVEQAPVGARGVAVVAKCAMLLFPLGVLGAQPIEAEDGRLAVRRPAGELCPAVLVRDQLLTQDAPALAVGPDYSGAHRLDVDVATAG